MTSEAEIREAIVARMEAEIRPQIDSMEYYDEYLDGYGDFSCDRGCCRSYHEILDRAIKIVKEESDDVPNG